MAVQSVVVDLAGGVLADGFEDGDDVDVPVAVAWQPGRIVPP